MPNDPAPLTSHDLARRLLAMPDRPAFIDKEDVHGRIFEVTNARRFQPSDEDGDPLPPTILITAGERRSPDLRATSPDLAPYSKTPPTLPDGMPWVWYYCRNIGDAPNILWEGVVLIVPDGSGKGLVAHWLSAPGESLFLHSSNWSPDAEWSGPVRFPTF